MRRIIATLLTALPLAALAQGDAPPPAEAPRAGEAGAPASVPAVAAPAVTRPTASQPSWSLGAGIGFGTLFGGFAFVGSLPVGLSTFGTVTTSLERRVGERTWLEFGVAGSFTDERNAWENVPTTNLPAEDRTVLAQVSAGLRRLVTSPGAPVGISVDALAEGGVVDRERESFISTTSGVVRVVEDQTGWLAGGSLGLAVERVLVERLSLRLATPLVGVRYAKTTTDTVGGAHVDSSGWAASLVVAPRLELRLAF